MLDGNLDLGGYQLGDKFTLALANGIKDTFMGNCMNLSNNRLNDVSVPSIITNLGEFLEVLDLSCNEGLGEQTYKMLAEVLESRPHVPLK